MLAQKFWLKKKIKRRLPCSPGLHLIFSCKKSIIAVHNLTFSELKSTIQQDSFS